MPSIDHETYPLDQSPFYKLQTRKKLAEVLFLSTAGMKKLAGCADEYRCWDEPKKSGGTRRIEAPPESLKLVQRRISDQLQRITPPPYLSAPVKGRSYVHNAATHVGARAFRLLDVEDFFPSCTDKRVFWFFNTAMQCSRDVAAVLTKLTTLNGHLPQGSPCSPILAYFAYHDMWDDIHAIVSRAGCKLSIYADDITISGDVIYERDVWAIKQVLHRAGHRYSQKKERSIVGKPADITGVIVDGDDLLLPNRQHRELAAVRKQRQAATGHQDREKLDRKIRGRVAQANQISKHFERVGR
ncbi:MAG: RNA-directed DNA polymerase [Sphingomonadaceae bacterium]|nr:RNA-directed DNA polymerase [Sphingomonadaceae bacterium]